jgi:hypothetical protein
MEISYIHHREIFLKGFNNFYNLRFYRQLRSAAISLFAGLAVWILVLSGLSSRYILYLGSFLVIYALMMAISELASRHKIKKLIMKRLNQIAENSETSYIIASDKLRYADSHLETNSDWSLHKGFFVYRECIYIMPVIETSYMYFIHNENLKENEFDILLEKLAERIPRLELKEINSAH